MGLVAAVRLEALEAWPVSTAVNNPNFDDVWVLEGVEHEAVGESAQYRAVEVQWIAE